MDRMPDKPKHARLPASDAARPDGPVIGVDPGLRRTGYAVLAEAALPSEARICEAGVIRLQAADALPLRLLELDRCLDDLLTAHGPALLVCEELYAHYKHPRTAILMGHARGVILAAAARRGIEVISVAATNVKKLLTGSGRADKRQIQRAVAATLGLPRVPEPHDVADAIAIALCGLRMRAGRAAVARSIGRRR